MGDRERALPWRTCLLVGGAPERTSGRVVMRCGEKCSWGRGYGVRGVGEWVAVSSGWASLRR